MAWIDVHRRKIHAFWDTWHRFTDREKTCDVLLGNFYDQGDAKRMRIRGQFKRHNDTPFRWPTPGWPIGRPVVGRPQGVFGGLSYYWLIICFFNIVPLIVEFTSEVTKHNKKSQNKVVTKPQARSNCDVTSFRSDMGTDRRTGGPTNGPTNQHSEL
jgi:hypothetical protein